MVGNIAVGETEEQRERRLGGSTSPVNMATMDDESPLAFGASGDTQPGWFQFMKHYWLAWGWIGLALFTLVVLLLLLNDYTRINQINASLVPLLTAGIVAALYRGFRNGFRFRRERAITEGGMTGLVLNLVLWGVQIALATVVWPFVEIFRQTRFLVDAWSHWRSGKILINENQRPALCG